MITIILIVLCIVFAPVLFYAAFIALALPVLTALSVINWILNSVLAAGNWLGKNV